MKRTLVCLAALAMLISPTRAKAGSADAGILFVNMAPNGSGEASRQCTDSIRRGLRTESQLDAIQPRAIGETAFRRIAESGVENADEPFLTWRYNDEFLERLYQAETHEDANSSGALLVDCRPEDNILRVAFYGISDLRIELNTQITDEVREHVTRRIENEIWRFFQP